MNRFHIASKASFEIRNTCHIQRNTRVRASGTCWKMLHWNLWKTGNHLPLANIGNMPSNISLKQSFSVGFDCLHWRNHSAGKNKNAKISTILSKLDFENKNMTYTFNANVERICIEFTLSDTQMKYENTIWWFQICTRQAQQILQ